MSQNNAKWIWYPGEFELWLNKRVASSRLQKGSVIPPFWRVDSCSMVSRFQKEITLEKPETVHVYAQGTFNVELHPGQYAYHPQRGIPLEPGTYAFTVTVFCADSFPAILVDGETVFSDESWQVSNGDTTWTQACGWTFRDKFQPPDRYRLSTVRVEPVGADAAGVYDFGREIMGYLRLEGLIGSGELRVVYGESYEEAMAEVDAYQTDALQLASPAAFHRFPIAKAFRYVRLTGSPCVQVERVAADSEYLDVPLRAAFSGGDPQLDRIWDTAQYTLFLNMREFLFDGIKRDRWVWCGDVAQSIHINAYSYADADINRRTLRLLVGRPPFTAHINHIMDYTFFWVIGLYDHYLYTGDTAFLREMYPRLQEVLAFCRGRANEDGLLEGRPEDWVFIDWADIDNAGIVSTEQILYVQALFCAADIAEALGDTVQAQAYRSLAGTLRETVFRMFWKDEYGGFIHSWKNGKPDGVVTRYPNLFALLYGWLDGRRRQMAVEQLVGTEVMPIGTPYMRLYELAALCAAGQKPLVLEEMRRYWGGMLDKGATTFWEAYDPDKSAVENYAMYGEPFGKSLCHAWGSGPVYLLGRYFLGVEPTKPGYAEYRVSPAPCGMGHMEGTVPTPQGDIRVEADAARIRVEGCRSPGRLILPDGRWTQSDGTVCAGGQVAIGPGETVEVTYVR